MTGSWRALGDEPRVGGVDAADVGEDLAAVGAEAGGQGDRGRVAAAAAERRDLVAGRVAAALWPWKPATMTTLPASSSRRTRRGSMPAMRARP